MSEQKSVGTLTGTVVSRKMQKTIVVDVARSYLHPRLEKVMRVHEKYKVHDAKEEAREGDIVEISVCRPISKTKYMRLIRIVESAVVQ